MASDNASLESPDQPPIGGKDWSYFTSTYPDVVGNEEYFGEPWRKLILKVFVENEDSLKTINEKLNEVELLSPQTIEIVWAFTKFTTPPDEVHTIIIGQDPSPYAESGDGLAFSVRDDFKHPSTGTSGITPSSALQTIVNGIKNSFKDCGDDIIKPQFDEKNCCSLKNWAKQGVLLMNTCLTRTDGTAEENKHFDIGWQKIVGSLIVKVIKEVNTQKKRGVFIIAMGSRAKKLCQEDCLKNVVNNGNDDLSAVDNVYHETYHPCAEQWNTNYPTYNYKYIDHFKDAYDFLKERCITVDWSIIYNSEVREQNINQLKNMAFKDEKNSERKPEERVHVTDTEENQIVDELGKMAIK